jgi:C-terminal peptidase prc
MRSRNHFAALLALALAALTGPWGIAGQPGQEGKDARPPDSARKDAARFADWVLSACAILHENHFKAPEERELVGWAARGLWERFNRTTPPGLKRLLNRINGMPRAELRALLMEVRGQLGGRPELDDYRDVDIAVAAIFKQLDPGASQEPVREQIGRWIVCDVRGFGYQGPGLILRRHAVTGMLEVETPLRDGPGYRAGIQSGDVITRITLETSADGWPLPEPVEIPTKELSVEAAWARLRGRPGTKVKLSILRPGAAKEVTIEVTRGRAERETVLGARRKKDDRWDHLLNPQQKIAYVRLTRFDRHTPRDLEEALRALSKGGLKGLVLDLRFNSGGLLDSTLKAADLFIDDGRLLSIRSRHSPETVYALHSGRSYTRFPMVCLVNAETTRGAELLAACLQDHGRAVIVGERTPGDTTIRSILPWRSGAELHFTAAVYYRANGKNLARMLTSGREDEGWGVRPDKGFALSLSAQGKAALHEQLKRLEIIPRRDGLMKPPPRVRDRQLDMALAYLRKQAEKVAAAHPMRGRERDWLQPTLKNRAR